MAYTTIDDPSAFFNTVLTTGAGAGSYTGVGFQPDFLWFKRRDSSGPHFLIDSTRGSSKYLASESGASETTDATFLTSIDSDGWTGGSGFYGSPATLATWNWKANGGTTSSNTDGSITSTVQANTTAGFSIVTWTGDANNTSTVGHGLGKVPKIIIMKNRSDTADWCVCGSFSPFGINKRTPLNGTGAISSPSDILEAIPTTTLFQPGNSNDSNGSGDNMLAYCFADIEGYSKFGSYTGNGSNDGAFVYTGFRPAWIMVKRITSGAGWSILDAKRNEFNPVDKLLQANVSNQEFTPYDVDFISNGFKWRTTDSTHNQSGSTFIYMAFAEHPFVSSKGVPVTAR